MTRTPDLGHPVDTHSSLDTIRMNPPTHIVRDFHSRAVGSFVGWFNGYTSDYLVISASHK
jgi:hypothetical protein